MVLDVRNLDLKTKLFIKYIKIINVYDQIIDREYIYLKIYTRRRKAIKEI